MALTATQKASIRLYCGWSARFHSTDSRLEMAMGAADNDAELLVQIASILASLAAIETKITALYDCFKAQKVGNITLDPKLELGMLRSEGRRFVGRLATLLGVEVRHDVFSGYGPRHFAGYYGIYGGSTGNLPPIG